MYELRCVICRFLLLFVLLWAATVNAEFDSLGVTLVDIRTMLTQEGLNPTWNKFPQSIAAQILNPNINIEMYGPEDRLNGIEIMIYPTTNENDGYWQSFVCLWVLAAVFPNWENREEWFVRTINGFATGMTKDKVDFVRDGKTIQMGMINSSSILLYIEGRKIIEE